MPRKPPTGLRRDGDYFVTNVTPISLLVPSHFVGDSSCDFAGRQILAVVGPRRCYRSRPRPRAFGVAMFPRRTTRRVSPWPTPAFRYRLRWDSTRPVEIPPALVAVAVVVDHAPVRCSGAYVADDSARPARAVPERGFPGLNRILRRGRPLFYLRTAPRCARPFYARRQESARRLQTAHRRRKRHHARRRAAGRHRFPRRVAGPTRART